MNLSSSLSISSASASPSSRVSFSFDSKGCIAGILHRILCSRSLPTYPSDHITDSSSVFQDQKCKELEETKQTSLEEDEVVAPSIVARLMGLESMPNKTPVGVRRPNSITRSRSMNSLNCKGGMDQNQVQVGHRRVKSSTLSVSQMPTFFELENEEFLVLSFENGSEETKRKTSSSRRKKTDTSSLLSKSSCEKQVCPGIENPECSTPVKNKEESESETVKFRKRRKKKKRVENECCSEESSPVSVLDFDQYMTDHEVPRSELDTNLVESSSRRKLSSEPGDFEFQFEPRIQRNDSNLMISEDKKEKKSEGKCVGSRKKGSWLSQSHMEMWDQICKMTEHEIAGSTWLYGESNNILKKHEDFEQICADFELQIVDQSLHELVQQLVELHMKF